VVVRIGATSLIYNRGDRERFELSLQKNSGGPA
jgi:hypothetical protein